MINIGLLIGKPIIIKKIQTQQHTISEKMQNNSEISLGNNKVWIEKLFLYLAFTDSRISKTISAEI